MKRAIDYRRLCPIVLAPLVLGGCGGGGSSPPPQTIAPPPPAPPVVAPPAPPPAPSPSPQQDEDANSNAPNFANAPAAYALGATGKGVTIAFIDSGIDRNSPEFAGRIAASSADLAGNRGIQSDAPTDVSGSASDHGTFVASIAAAARNGQLTHGVAYDATLQVLRADDPGSCAMKAGCTFADTVIANGVSAAASAGARVVNISLGAMPASGTSQTPDPSFVSAVTAATAKGVVIVFAAGNDSATSVNPLASSAVPASVNNGAVIIAGAVDSNGTIASFSDRPGTSAAAQAITLNALGVGVNITGIASTSFTGDGTSFSAPAIAGAVALLAQRFPNLTGQQIVTLLLTTATDAGAPGVDPVYGRGILNIQAAFAPQGTTAAAGIATPVSAYANGVGGGALGNASRFGQALNGVVVLDSYRRAYKIDVGRTVARAPAPRLAGALFAQSVRVGLGSTARHVAFTLAPGAGADRPELGLAQQGLDAIGAGGSARAGVASVSLWHGAEVALGFGNSFASMSEPAAPGTADFLVAPGTGLDRVTAFQSARGVTAVQRLGRWAISVGAGSTQDYRTVRTLDPLRTNDWRVGADRRLGRATFGVSVAGRDERGGLLGATLGPAFGIARAHTTTLGLDGGIAFAGGWHFGASARHGWTQATTGTGLVQGIDSIRSFGWRLDFAKDGVIAAGDRFSLRIVQPMRVVDGVARLSVPVAYDYATGAVTNETRYTSLAPSGTERDIEAVYRRELGWAGVSGHAFVRTEPADEAGVGSDKGFALTLDAAF